MRARSPQQVMAVLAAAASGMLVFAPTVFAQATEPVRARLRPPEAVMADSEPAAAPAASEQSEQRKKDAKQAKEYEVGTDLRIEAKWNNGVEFATPNQDFVMRVRGRMQQDWGWGQGDAAMDRSVGEMVDGAIFRRLRLGAQGRTYEIFEWLAEMEFAGGTAGPADFYLDITQLPVIGRARFGHFFEPFSLDQMTSDNYIPFLERSLFDEAFGTGRNVGVMLTNLHFDERLTWAAGVFRAESDATGFDFGGGEYAYTARLTGLPWYEHEGRYLLHLGVAASHRIQNNDADDLLRLRARPELRAVRTRSAGVVREAFLVDTGALRAHSLELVGLESAFVAGPFSMQAEYVWACVQNARTADGIGRGDPSFHGLYVMASYFLTGESRNYRRASAGFDRITPLENFFLVRDGLERRRLTFGRGAWELLARYSYLDLNDSGVTGGVLQDLTLGVTWYFGPNGRIMANYILAHRDAAASVPAAWANVLGVRIQFDF
jgi:phosphate-selective porin OprO and OprP